MGTLGFIHWLYDTNPHKQTLKQEENKLTQHKMKKTIEEILYKHTPIETNGNADYISVNNCLKAMQAYAQQQTEIAVGKALEIASENANLNNIWTSSFDGKQEIQEVDACSIGDYRYIVNKQSILSLKKQIIEQLNN